MYCLVNWPEEDSVSVVPQSCVSGGKEECLVKICSGKYKGRVVAVGKLGGIGKL